MEPSPPSGRVAPYLAAVVGLALLVALVHGPSIWDGTFYDDHWHRYTLKNYGWSWNDLTESTTFDFPGRLLNFWWQPHPVQWRYPRPVAMFFQKVEYHLAGGSVMGIHAFGMGWHWLCACLVYGLARWVLRSGSWSFLAAAAFVLNPNSVYAVSWAAARNALVGTFFLLAAVLFYLRASFDRNRQPKPLHFWPLIFCIPAWLLSLFCRETAIVFPVLAGGLDAAFGGRQHFRRRLPILALFVAISAGYVAWRLWIFPRTDMPREYFQPLDRVETLIGAGSKLLQMVSCMLLQLPMVTWADPVAEGWTWRILVGHAAMIAFLIPVFIIYFRHARAVRGGWFWPVWLVAALLPVAPVITLPHFSHLPFVGLAIGRTEHLARQSGRRRLWATVGFFAVLCVAHVGHRYLWRSLFRAEQSVYADIQWSTPRPGPGSHLFFINLPSWASFGTQALREAWDRDDLDGRILTLAPEPYRMKRPSTVERLNDHEILVSTPLPGYFDSFLERVFLRMTRSSEPLTQGTVVTGDLFDTTVVETVGNGVSKLKFTFHQPLNTPGYYFYVSTPERPAYRLRIERPQTPTELAAETERFNAAHVDMLAERDWLFGLMDRLKPPEPWERDNPRQTH